MSRFWRWISGLLVACGVAVGGFLFDGYDDARDREIVALELHLLRTYERAQDRRDPEPPEKFREYAEHVVAYYAEHPVPEHVDRVARELLEELDP